MKSSHLNRKLLKSSKGIPTLHIKLLRDRLSDESHLANELLVKDLKVSDGWLHQFKGRQGLLFRKAQADLTTDFFQFS